MSFRRKFSGPTNFLCATITNIEHQYPLTSVWVFPVYQRIVFFGTRTLAGTRKHTNIVTFLSNVITDRKIRFTNVEFVDGTRRDTKRKDSMAIPILDTEDARNFTIEKLDPRGYPQPAPTSLVLSRRDVQGEILARAGRRMLKACKFSLLDLID